MRVVAPAALVAVLVVIWLLTIQTPAETTSLSGIFSGTLARLTGIDPERASWAVRKVVHTVEFFPVGLTMALTALAWLAPEDQRRHRRVALVVLALCFACSLGDQVHKTFVPGREFDALDMAFDAAGYVLGILLAAAIARHATARTGKHLRRS